MAKWVQHISGMGKKWKIRGTTEGAGHGSYCVEAGNTNYSHYLPFSDYVECEPPEEWEDVSRDCYVTFSTLLEEYKVVCIGHNQQHLYEAEGYRLRKIDGLHNGPAFIVERRKV